MRKQQQDEYAHDILFYLLLITYIMYSTHNYILFLSLSISLSPSLSISIYLYLSHSHTHTLSLPSLLYICISYIFAYLIYLSSTAPVYLSPLSAAPCTSNPTGLEAAYDANLPPSLSPSLSLSRPLFPSLPLYRFDIYVTLSLSLSLF